MMGDWGWGYGWMGGFGWFWMVLVWVGTLALVTWGVGRLFGSPQAPRSQTPLEILKGRFASGELSEEEYERARQTLARS